MASTALVATLFVFISKVSAERCVPDNPLLHWNISSWNDMYAPFDCPKPDDPPGHKYCCGSYIIKFCCPERCHDSYAVSCPSTNYWDTSNTNSGSDSGTYDSGHNDYYDSDDSGFSMGGTAILGVALMCIVCAMAACCKYAYKREEELSREMTSPGMVTTYVDVASSSSPGRVRGRATGAGGGGTVIHPTVMVHPRSSDRPANRADPSPFNSADSRPSPFSSPSHTPGFPATPPSAPPPQVPSAPPSYYPPATAPPSAAHAPPPFLGGGMDEPPPYDVATMYPTVDPEQR